MKYLKTYEDAAADSAAKLEQDRKLEAFRAAFTKYFPGELGKGFTEFDFLLKAVIQGESVETIVFKFNPIICQEGFMKFEMPMFDDTVFINGKFESDGTISLESDGLLDMVNVYEREDYTFGDGKSSFRVRDGLVELHVVGLSQKTAVSVANLISEVTGNKITKDDLKVRIDSGESKKLGVEGKDLETVRLISSRDSYLFKSKVSNKIFLDEESYKKETEFLKKYGAEIPPIWEKK